MHRVHFTLRRRPDSHSDGLPVPGRGVNASQPIASCFVPPRRPLLRSSHARVAWRGTVADRARHFARSWRTYYQAGRSQPASGRRAAGPRDGEPVRRHLRRSTGMRDPRMYCSTYDGAAPALGSGRVGCVPGGTGGGGGRAAPLPAGHDVCLPLRART